MSEKYYRGLRNFLNDTKHKLQLASMTLKINENKNSISGIKSDISGINNFSDKINDNSSNISSNLSKINDNDNDIDEIRSNLNNIKNDLSDFKINYAIQNLFIYNIDVEQNYTLNKDNPTSSIFSYNLEDDFKSNSILEVNCKILYNYTTYNNIGTLMHVFKLYDENNELIYEYNNLKSNSGDNLSAFLNHRDMYYVKLNENYSIIKIELILSILDNITKSVSCKLLNTFKSNFLYIKHYKKINTLSVNNNLTDLENGISSNLIKINSNEDDILYNLSEINNIKNNISKSYLKNIYNVLFYDEKTQIDFREDIFYEKIFDVNSSINDFIEISFKIQLEYQDTDDRNYVKTLCQLFDENNNTLYIKSVNNNEYQYFSNKLTIDENIFYNFINNTKKLKIVIKFQKLSPSRVIKIWYIKNDNYRLILKHYGN